MTNKITLDITEDLPFAAGQSFGDTGPYRRLTGRAYYAVDLGLEGLDLFQRGFFVGSLGGAQDMRGANLVGHGMSPLL